ncbi:hypothetical protein TNCV_3159111 [Trichonephila clavipes]|nr:hypothetical protein TNCV_3159111 [Trichonephila clavipes]
MGIASFYAVPPLPRRNRTSVFRLAATFRIRSVEYKIPRGRRERKTVVPCELAFLPYPSAVNTNPDRQNTPDNSRWRKFAFAFLGFYGIIVAYLSRDPLGAMFPFSAVISARVDGEEKLSYRACFQT